jgi:flagellar protein FliJ
MARKSSQRLQVLLKLAALKEETAARRLAQDSERLQQAREQGRQLALYEQDYQQTFIERGAQTLNRQNLLNYQGFFRQLEHVQEQQGRTIEQRDRERENARLHWVQLYSRRRVLTQIRERRLALEQLAADKKLQSEIDDHTARRRAALAAEANIDRGAADSDGAK